MTIQKALLSAVKKLQHTQNTAHNTQNTSPHLDAEVLLAFVLKKPKGYLLSHQGKNLTPSHLKKFNFLILRRQRGKPISYLTNHKEFYKLDFYISENVLIPRPETETLVEEAIKCTRHLQKTINRKPLTIYDIGTGSGCIAITLAKYLPDIKVMATDISEKALAVAKKNAKQHKVLRKIKFIKGDLLKSLIKKSKAPKHKAQYTDLIVANLPYLTKDELQNIRHEPKQALYGGKMGLELIERLITQAEQVLNPKGIILLEISPAQVKYIEYLVEQHLPSKRVFFIKDLGERDRVARIE